MLSKDDPGQDDDDEEGIDRSDILDHGGNGGDR
jgi:hypothetical protein